jgi:hypothetical protein
MGVTPDAPSASEPSVAKLAGPSLFIRNATGLVREVGLGQAFVINLSVLNPAVGRRAQAATLSSSAG